MDSHLLGPAADGSRFHLYWKEKAPTPEATLDVDVLTGYWPETITINQLLPGIYRYAVHYYYNGLFDPLGPAHMATSPTLVELYDADGLIQSFTVPLLTEMLDLNTLNMFDIAATEDNFEVSITNVWSLNHSEDMSGRVAAVLKDPQ
jgi:hypothetical protein